MKDLWLGTFNVASGKQPDKIELKRWLAKQEIAILGLQEVDEYTRRTPYSMVDEVKGNYLYDYFSKAISFEEGEYGNAILSNFELKEKESHYFQHFGFEERIYQRGLIEIDGKKLAVYHTHLSFESKEIRPNQVRELLRTIKKEKANYIVILGDFNMDQSLEEWEVFHEYQLVNGRNGIWYQTFNEPDDKMKVFSIDNIILSNNIKIEEVRVNQTNLSDHSLLATKISLL